MNQTELDEALVRCATWTDDQVASLRLGAPQRELLDQIRARPVRRRPAVTLVAAAVVLVVGVVPLALLGGRDRSGHDASSAADGSDFTAEAVRSAAAGPRLLLDEPGWRLTYLGAGGQSFHRGPGDVIRAVPGGADRVLRGQDLEIDWRPAGLYDGYRRDRVHGNAVHEVEVLGATGLMITYAPGDYAVLTKPARGIFVEIRASGLADRAGFVRLLGRLRQVGARAWLRSLPGSVVVPTEDGAATGALLDGVPLPPRTTTTDLTPGAAETRGQYLAHVVGAVTCAWIADWEAADRDGDDVARDRAADVLGAASSWPALMAMPDDNVLRQLVTQRAAEVAAGRDPVGYRADLECGAS